MWMHHISRRRMLQLAASTALIATVRPQSLLNQAWAEEGQARDAGKLASQDLLRTRVSRPYDAETHVSAFNEWITPNKSFFVRSHFGPSLAYARDPYRGSFRLTAARRSAASLASRRVM